MKSNAEIIAMWDENQFNRLLALIRFIKADALRHAAKMVDDRRHNGLDTDLRSIRSAIEAEAEKLEEQ